MEFSTILLFVIKPQSYWDAVGSATALVPGSASPGFLKSCKTILTTQAQNCPLCFLSFFFLIETYISSLTRDVKNQFHKTYFF